MGDYIEKQKNKQREQQNKMMGSYGSNSGELYLKDGPEGNEQAANLSQVGAMTGQNLWDTGRQQQDYLGSLQNRRSGQDATAQRMIAQRNRNMANVGRSMAGRGVAGGVAASALNSAQAQADTQIADQMQDFSKSNDKELYDYVKRNQKITGEALAMGSERGLANQIDTSSASGMSVVCTELHRQGLLDSKTYQLDAMYGYTLSLEDPYVLVGYWTFGIPMAKLMRKSKLFTKLVSLIAIPWAKNLGGSPNFIGKFLMKVGVPFCRILGKLKYSKVVLCL